jgi:hypothetical protein
MASGLCQFFRGFRCTSVRIIGFDLGVPTLRSSPEKLDPAFKKTVARMLVVPPQAKNAAKVKWAANELVRTL